MRTPPLIRCASRCRPGRSRSRAHWRSDRRSPSVVSISTWTSSPSTRGLPAAKRSSSVISNTGWSATQSSPPGNSDCSWFTVKGLARQRSIPAANHRSVFVVNRRAVIPRTSDGYNCRRRSCRRRARTSLQLSRPGRLKPVKTTSNGVLRHTCSACCPLTATVTRWPIRVSCNPSIRRLAGCRSTTRISRTVPHCCGR